MTHVKPRRRYDASGRRDQARRNREAVLDAARRRFLTDGYAATTVTDIAGDAGVSNEMIYKSFGGKAGLVRTLHERGLEGQQETPAFERSDRMRERESDPRTIMREWGLLTAEVAGVVSPIRLLLRSAAATDADLAAVLAQSEAERLERMRHHALFLAEQGHLRAGVSAEDALDILWAASSVELYELMVLQRGWSQARFATFLTQLMVATLLDGE